MVREQQAFVFWNRLRRCRHRSIQLIYLRGEEVEVCGVGVGVRWIELAQNVTHDFCITARHWRIRPQVRIRFSALLRKGEVVDPLLFRQDGRAEFADDGIVADVAEREVLRGLLQHQTVHEHHIGLFQHRRRTWWWLEGVRVGALRNQSNDLCSDVSRHLSDQAGDGCHGGDHAQRATLDRLRNGTVVGRYPGFLVRARTCTANAGQDEHQRPNSTLCRGFTPT